MAKKKTGTGSRSRPASKRKGQGQKSSRKSTRKPELTIAASMSDEDTTIDENAAKGPSIIRHVNRMYKGIVIKTWMEVGHFDISEQQETEIKRLMCQQIHTILRKEREYCIQFFYEVLQGYRYDAGMMGTIERQVGGMRSHRYLTLEEDCKKIKAKKIKTSPSA